MRCVAFVLLLCFAAVAWAETASSPYRLRWSFPDDDLSAIDIDRGNLSKGRFETPYELVKYLSTLKDKPKKSKPGGPPMRELRVEQLDSDGAVRSTNRYVAPLEVWRKRLGEPMVERLEDEFDAHLRMILPRKVAPPETPK